MIIFVEEKFCIYIGKKYIHREKQRKGKRITLMKNLH